MWKNIVKQVLFETKMEMLFPNYKEITEMIDLPNDNNVQNVLKRPQDYKLADAKSVLENRLYKRDYFLIYNSQTSEFDMLIKECNSKYCLWSNIVFVHNAIDVIYLSYNDLQLLIENLFSKLNQMNCLAFRLDDTFHKGIFFNVKYNKDKRILECKKLNSLINIRETNNILILKYLIEFINHPISSDEFRLEIRKKNLELFEEYQSKVSWFKDFLKR